MTTTTAYLSNGRKCDIECPIGLITKLKASTLKLYILFFSDNFYIMIVLLTNFSKFQIPVLKMPFLYIFSSPEPKAQR